MTAMELLLMISDDRIWMYYDPIDQCFTDEHINSKKAEKLLAYKKKRGSSNYR